MTSMGAVSIIKSQGVRSVGKEEGWGGVVPGKYFGLFQCVLQFFFMSKLYLS